MKLALAALLLVSSAAGATDRCLVKTYGGFARVRSAQQAIVAHCLTADDPDRCLAVDWRGRLAKATAQARRGEQRACGHETDAAVQASASVLQTAHAVFGGARATSRCQRAVLAALDGCAARFLAGFRDCIAHDGIDLVRCKGVDPRGRIAAACGTKLDKTLRAHCAAADAGALFPGCTGSPLIACLAGHAKSGVSRAINATSGLCAVAGPPPPAPEPIDFAVVPMPGEVTSLQFPWWTPDGSRIMFSARLAGRPNSEIVSIAPDGGDFRCLTCPLAVPGTPALLKPFPFADGTRVFFRIGEQTPLNSAHHAILECAPSYFDCQTPVLVPVDFPTDATVTQDQREPRLAPDGVHIGFTQVHTDADGLDRTVSVVGVLHRLADRYEVVDARVVTTLGELKQFTHDQRQVVVGAFNENPYAAINPDAVLVDLADGTVTRLTRHPDYDEDTELSPDQRWFLVGSGRTGHFFDVFSQVPRPGLVNAGLNAITTFFFLTQRAPLLEPWLVDRDGERGDYVGQRLNPGSQAAGYDGRMQLGWSPDGTRIAFSELLSYPQNAAPDAPGSRLAIVTLSSRAPATPVTTQPLPSLDWAPPLAGFVPPPNAPTSRAGAVSGRVDVTIVPGPTRTLRIVYTDFSDDGRAIIDGSEDVAYTPGLVGPADYDAAVTLRGCDQGLLAADGVHVQLVTMTGTVTSEVDGQVLHRP